MRLTQQPWEAWCAQPLPESAREGVALFNAGRFFEAHEALEDAWRAEVHPGRALYQGLLQAAVVCLHLQRGNLRGARKVYRRCMRHLAPLPAVCRGVAVGRLRDDLARLMEAALHGVRPLSFPRVMWEPSSACHDRA